MAFSTCESAMNKAIANHFAATGLVVVRPPFSKLMNDGAHCMNLRLGFPKRLCAY